MERDYTILFPTELTASRRITSALKVTFAITYEQVQTA